MADPVKKAEEVKQDGKKDMTDEKFMEAFLASSEEVKRKAIDAVIIKTNNGLSRVVGDYPDQPSALWEVLPLLKAFKPYFPKSSNERKKAIINIMFDPYFPLVKFTKFKASVAGHKRNVLDILKKILDILPAEVYEKHLDDVWSFLQIIVEEAYKEAGDYWSMACRLINKIDGGSFSQEQRADLSPKIDAILNP